jgi:hypothetical protein
MAAVTDGDHLSIASIVFPMRRRPIAEYSRLTLGLPRHGTCEQMPRFWAAA